MLCCPLCTYATKFPSWLRKHSVVHSKGHRPFVCDACGLSFTSLSNLNHHKKTHEAPSFVCSLCDFKCTQKRILVTHVRVHSDDRPFRCEFCQYSTKRKSDLSIHHRCMHTGRPRKKRREEDVAGIFDALSIRYVREYTISFQQR